MAAKQKLKKIILTTFYSMHSRFGQMLAKKTDCKENLLYTLLAPAPLAVLAQETKANYT